MLERVRLAVGGSILLLLTLVAAPSARAVTVIDFASYLGHDYYLLSEGTWTESEAAAIGLGGHLATIDDAAENDFVSTRFGVVRSLWIGLTDANVEGTYVWASGAPLLYTNWFTNEPSDCTFVGCFSEDFVEIYQDYGGGTVGRWNDLTDDNPLFGVVEVVPVPEPSSLLLLGLAGGAVVYRVRRRR